MEPQMMIHADGVQEVIIHFSHRIESGEVIACSHHEKLPQQKDRPFPIARSDDPRVVNCRFCMSTEAFRVKMADAREAMTARKVLV